VLGLTLALHGTGWAAEPVSAVPVEVAAADSESAPADLVIANRPILTLRASVLSVSAAERARSVAERADVLVDLIVNDTVPGLRALFHVATVTPDVSLEASADSYDPVGDPGSVSNSARLMKAPAAWDAGASGQGIDVALIDTGVAPVGPLANPSTVANGPDLSFDGQSDSTRYLATLAKVGAKLFVEQESLTATMASDVLFSSGSAQLYPGGREKLRNFAGVLTRYPRTTIQVVGNTDSRGSEDSNMELSRKRAQAVADELVAAGVSTGRISTRAVGESMPIATNDTPEGRAQNRRVEIVVSPDQGLRAEQQQQQGGAAPAGGAEEPR